VVVTVVVVLGAGVVVVGPGVGEPVTSLNTAYATRASNITPTAPAATSANGRRYHGVGGSGGWGASS
jgi:hypothetical protein